MVNNKTKIYGSIATKKGVLGTRFYNMYFALENINAIYIPFQITSIKNAILILKELNFSGLSVSMPFKKEVISYLSFLEGQAIDINIVNTVLNYEGKLIGYNTDAIAVKNFITKDYAILKNKHVVIFGYGAMASVVVECLKNIGIQKFSILGRNKDKILNFYKHHKISRCAAMPRKCVLINCSPVGMFKVILTSPFPEIMVQNSYLVWDFVNHPRKTELIIIAKKYNKPYRDGYSFSSIQIQHQLKLYLNCSSVDKISLNHALRYALE